MGVGSANSIGYDLTGVLYHSNGDRAIKQHVHVYDNKGGYIGHTKTQIDGRFYVTIRNPAPLDQKIEHTFCLCSEKKIAREHEELGKDPGLCKNLDFFRGRTETAEAIETFALKQLIDDHGKEYIGQDLGEVHLEKPYEKEEVPLCYNIDIAKAAIPAEVTSKISSLKENLDFFNKHGIDDVLKAFDVESTPLTAENTWKLITNGICPLYLKEEGEYYTAEIDWSRYEFDKLQALADVKLWFKKNGNLTPTLEKIEVKFRETKEPSSDPKDYTPLRTYKISDEDFEEGLRIANCSIHLFGQSFFHLGIGHTFPVSTMIPALELPVDHPLRNILMAHSQYNRKISIDLGEPVIFGKDGVLNVSALSVKGIANVISDAVATAVDPFSFEPRKPVNDDHVFAKLQNLHYKILQEAVKEYFDKHWEEMTKDWSPVHGFFTKLFKRSPEYRPFGGVSPFEGSWRDSSEIGGKETESLPKRQKYRESDDAPRSFRPIATSEFGPLPGEREWIEKFVVYFIFDETIYHTYLHLSQYISTEASPSVADVNFAPLALSNYGKGKYGGMQIEDAIHQLKIISLFENFNTENYSLLEDPKVYEGIKRRIKEKIKEYTDNGFDPNKIMSSTAI